LELGNLVVQLRKLRAPWFPSQNIRGDADPWRRSKTPWRKTLNSFGEIADGAQILVDHCTKREFEASMTLITSGQVFHRDGWSVIVREDKADC